MSLLGLTLPVTDPVLIVAITMGILLVGPLLFERLRVPGLVGLIALGAVAGPSVTGLLERDATFVLLGTFGLLYLMFMAGLELNLGEFKKQQAKAIAFGVLSFGLPMGLALAAGTRLLGYSLPAAALLGAIVGSHTLLALPVAARLGITSNRALVIATGATLVTDLLSLVVLAVVQGVQSGEAGAAFWLRFAGLAALWGAFVLLGLPRIARAFFGRVRREDDLAFAFLLACVFLSAWLAGLVGLAPIIGAFLAGIALNRLIPKRSPLMTRLQFVGNAFLVPFFLVSVGLLVDVRVLGSLEVWSLALVFSALVVLGKGGAALLGRPLFGFTAAEGATVAGLTIPQAAATLAVTLIGFDIGLFSQSAVNAVVVLIVVSCLLGPSLVSAFGRKVALAEQSRPYEPADAPERIMVPLANPDTAEELMELALLVRSPTSEESVYPIAVARGGQDEASQVAAAEALMERAVKHATAADVPSQPTVRIDDNPIVGIVRGSRELRASEIIIGWTGGVTPGAVVFGGIIDGLLEQSRAMLMVARLAAPLAAARRLLVLVPPLLHREPGFARAVRSLKVLAAQKGLTLVALTDATDADIVEARMREARPEARVEVRPAAWPRPVQTLDDCATTGDIVTLLSVRPGAVAWRPGLQRLPRVLARRFPTHDLLTVYLSEIGVVATVLEAIDGEGDQDLALPATHIALHLPAGELGPIIRRMLQGGFPDHPGQAARIAEGILDEGVGTSPEIRPGVVLIHAHTHEIEQSMVFVGACPDGVLVDGAGQPARVLVVLLAPEEMRADRYLELLSVVAQMLRAQSVVDALLEAEEPDAARTLLLDGLRQSVQDQPMGTGAA
jgi:Kef-type K+ transport system membrane component KefB